MMLYHYSSERRRTSRNIICYGSAQVGSSQAAALVCESATVSDAATQELFAAISAHSSHGDYLDAERDRAALDRMRAALAAGASWRARLGPGQRDAPFAAATQGSRGPLEVLIDHGVPLDHAHGSDGMVIHRAAAFSNIDAVRMLVERGVAPDVRDASGRTPLAHARSWNHGARVVPVLIELMRAHGCTPAPARRGDDLRVETTRLPADAPAILRRTVEAFFVERAGGKAVDLLATLAEQRDAEALLAGIELVNRTSTAKPRTKVIAAGTKQPKRLTLVHHGDVELMGDTTAVSLVVTGNVSVHGLLTNYEGCIVGIGGSLEADAMWSEGPLGIAGDARLRDVFGVGDNDYGATIGGVLETNVFVQLDRHVVAAGELRAKLRVEDQAEVPEAAFVALRWKRR